MDENLIATLAPMTRTTTSTWIGVDPGGEENYGIALIEGSSVVHTSIVNCTDDAIKLVMSLLSNAPAGIGIDAPMWWSSARSGDRKVDQWLRETYGLSGGQVQTANSLRGAALVQGAMFAHRIREIYPDVPITETHPKALLTALKASNKGSFEDRFGVLFPSNEHIRDAIVSAIVAREGFSKSTSVDLSESRSLSEQDPKRYWLKPIHYLWPLI
jgi:predicted nuclease with RNAse H fold